MTFQLYNLLLPKANCLPLVNKLPSKSFLTLEGLRKVVTLGLVSPVTSRPALPLSHFPKRRAKLSFQARPRPQSFLKRESNLLPRIWYFSQWWWGARHPGVLGHNPDGLHNAEPSSSANRRSHRGTGHCEKQRFRVSSYRGKHPNAFKLLDRAEKPENGDWRYQEQHCPGSCQ